jgi:hypothetical protein
MPSSWRVGRFIFLGAIAAGCGSERRNAFEPEDGGTPRVSPDPQGLLDGGGSRGNLLCDETTLRAARSPAGCRFLTTEVSWSGDRLPNWEPEGCHPLLVSNPSTEPVHLRLRFQDRDEDAAPYSTTVTVDGFGATYSPLKGGVLQPGETAVVSVMYAARLPGDPSEHRYSYCPTKAFVESRAPAARHEAVTNAIEFSTDAPVLVFHVHDFQPSTNDGIPECAPTTLYPVFPTHLFAMAVIETGIFKPGLPAQLTSDADGGPVPYVTAPVRRVVLSAFDGTRVALLTPDGTTRSVSLQRGEVWADDPNDAFVGQMISANLPVGVLSFAPNALIPWDFPKDVVEDDRRALSATLPEALWGSEYVAVRHGDRWLGKAEMPPWRIIGGTDGTKLSYEPAMPDGAPTEIERGQLAVFYADAPFVVRSQDAAHAFYVGGHMTGPQYQKQRFGLSGDDTSDLRGAAVSLHAIASARWLRGYSFFGLATYPNLNLVVVRKSKGADVRLDCAGILTGWQPVGASYEYTRIALTGPLYEPVNGCAAGAHRIESADPFTATVWAWGDGETRAALGIWAYGAYGFPLLGVDPVAAPEAH